MFAQGTLLSNAIKYTPDGGSIEIRLFSTKRNWCLEVKDTGIGISKKAQQNLFTQFYRGENAINSNIPGSGIGLLMLRNFVQLHGGQVSVDSELHKGSSFVLRFRRGKDHFLKESTFIDDSSTLSHSSHRTEDLGSDIKMKQTLPSKSGRPTLLIAEDNSELRHFLSFTLNSNFDVLLAEDGQRAWELLQENDPDLVLTDVKMPRLDGIELAKKIRDNFATCHIPVILLSAMSDTADVLNGLRNGVDDYITKPFDVQVLQSKIQNLIQNRVRIKSIFTESKSLIDSVQVDEKDQEFIEKALELIEEHIQDSSFCVDRFSREMGVSRSLLYQKIKALTDQTPNEFVKLKRLHRAKELLKENKYTINEVATLSGFDDPRYFSTCFKKQYKVSPSKYFKVEKLSV